MKKYIILFLFTIKLFSLDIVIGFQEGGATDRMARTMATFLEKELKEKVFIKNIKGEGSLLAAKYVLAQPLNKRVLFASTFSPYLANTILTKDAKYKLKDFSMINLQWFDYDLIGVKKGSQYETLIDLLNNIKTSTDSIKVGVNYKSSGHLLLKILINKLNIPLKNIDISFFSGGKAVRNALFNNEIDFMIIPANGSELYKNKIKPLAVSKSKRTKNWDAPTLNEVLTPLGIKIPLINGSIRGFAVSTKFKEKYPEKYRYLISILKKLLATKKVQNELKNNHIGYTWIGEEKSNEFILNSYDFLKTYGVLLD